MNSPESSPTYDYLIVGAGLFGATFAHVMHAAGRRCLVVDRRPHTGGNVHCDRIEGIDVHTYGAHIFHTSDDEVWRFVTALTPFNRFTNSPIARFADRTFNLPFNMNTFLQMWGTVTPDEARAKIDAQRAEVLEALQKAGAEGPRNLEEQALSLVGRDIYEILIKEYTEKQWGRPCSELPAFIIRRLPVRFTFDNNYFTDAHQGIPSAGYNALVDKLLEGIEVRLETDFLAGRDELSALAKKVVFTGQIDAFFNECLGPLEYRTVRFESEILDTANYQGVAVVNYTSRDVPFTRCIEHKHFALFGQDVERLPKTVISREYSAEWTRGMEPYYPVNDAKNQQRYEEYARLANGVKDRFIFGGRLAEYRYYDMAPVVRRALDMARAELAK